MDNEAQEVYKVNCSKHFNVGQNFKLSNKIPDLLEVTPTSVRPSDLSPLQPNISPRPQPPGLINKDEPDLKHHQ